MRNIKTGSTVRIDHPYYGERTVTVLAVDEPMQDDGKWCYDCEIDGQKTWFDEDMVL